jgi:hypothetical protein
LLPVYFAALVLVAAASGQNADLHEKLAPIRAEIEREIKSGEIDPKGPVQMVTHQLEFIEEIRNRNGAPDEAILTQLRGLVGPAGQTSPKLRKVCEDLVTSFMSAQNEREKNRDASIDALVKEAADTIRSANESAGLSSVLGKIQQVLQQPGGDMRALDRLQRAMEVVRSWQQALADFEHGEFNRADGNVRSITQSSQAVFGSLIPVSFYEDRKNAFKAGLKKKGEDTIAAATLSLSLAKTEADARRVIDSLTGLEKYKLGAGFDEGFVRRLNAAISISRDLGEVLRSEGQGEFKSALISFNHLKGNVRANPGFLSDADLQARQNSLYAEAAKRLEVLLDRTAKDLPGVKVPDEISVMENKFSDFQEALRPRSHDYADLLLRLDRVKRVVAR